MAYVFVADHVSQEEVIELQIKKLDKPTRYACSICNKFVSRNARKVYLHIHDKHNKENRYILFSEWWTCKDDECEYYTFRRECALHHAKNMEMNRWQSNVTILITSCGIAVIVMR